MAKIYVVIRGRNVTVPVMFDNWRDCSICISGFPGALFKSFMNENDAKAFVKSHTVMMPKSPVRSKSAVEKLQMIDRSVAYVDGSSSKIGAGYGIVILNNGEEKHLSGKIVASESESIPTNNQAELHAIWKALDVTEGPLTIYSDSEYSINALTTWVEEWKRNGWKTASGNPVLNKNMIQEILKKIGGRDVCFIHVRGHNGNKYNELADQLAKSGAKL